MENRDLFIFPRENAASLKKTPLTPYAYTCNKKGEGRIRIESVESSIFSLNRKLNFERLWGGRTIADDGANGGTCLGPK